MARTITVHHGALACLLGINALRASEAAAVRIEDYAESLSGHRVLHLVGKGNKPATMPLTVPVLRVLEACRGQRTAGPLILRPVSGRPIDRGDACRMVARSECLTPCLPGSYGCRQSACLALPTSRVDPGVSGTGRGAETPRDRVPPGSATCVNRLPM